MNDRSLSIKTRIYESFNKNRDLIFGFSGPIGVFISIVGFLISIFANLEKQFIATVISFSIESFGLSILCVYLMKRLSNAGEDIRNSQTICEDYKKSIYDLNERINQHRYIESLASKISHNILHAHRDLFNKVIIDLYLKKNLLKERGESSKNFLIHFLTNTKEVFDLITHDSCSVCIKLLVKNEYDVKTYLRDPVSLRSRSDIDTEVETYPYYRNTAFDCILGHEKKNFFLSNDLLELEKQGRYRNYNQKWKDSYNACLVVPIRAVAKIEYNKNIGFLCVDNMKGGFDEIIAFNILAGFADLLYCHFQTIYYYKEAISPISLQGESE